MSKSETNVKFRNFLSFGIIGPLVVIPLTLLDVYLSPWFSWSSNALSDLGVHPYSYLFNGGLIFEAVSNFIFAIALRKLDLTSSGTAAALAVAGISLGFVGIFNENHPPFHLIFALIYFIVFPIAIIAFSAGSRAIGGYSRAVGYLCAIIGLVFIVVGIVQDFNVISTPFGLGVYELVEAIMLSIWTVYTGAFYLSHGVKTNMNKRSQDEKS